jgi:hypothetical protein
LQEENAPHPLQEAWRAVDGALDRAHGYVAAPEPPQTFAEYLARRNAAEAGMSAYSSGDTSQDTRDAAENTRDAGAPVEDISRSRKPNPFKNLVYPFTPNPSLWSYWLAYFGIAALLIVFGVSVLELFDAPMLTPDPVPLQSLAASPATSDVVG